jgi:hypothetical protein
MVEPLRHRQTKGAANRYARPTAAAPHSDSHGDVRVKRIRFSGACAKLPHCFGIQGLSLIARSGRSLTRSNSHSVAVRDGRTNVPLAAVGAQEDDTILYLGFLGHVGVRFVHLDPPELIKSWKI